MSKVLLIIGDATEVIDTMYPYFRIPEEGYEIVVAAPEVRLYHMVQHEIPPGWDLTQEMFEANKPVASVCHGIEIIAAADVIRGRRVTTVPKCALDCTFSGAEFLDQPVVVDGNLVCARTWHDNTPFMREYIKLLKASTS
jgi:protease I